MKKGRVEQMKKGKKDNRGLTLVELLVALAIISIVLVLIFGFFIQTMGFYNKGNKEAGVQNDAQLTMAQLESLVINANQGIGLRPGAGSDRGNDLYLYYRNYESKATSGESVVKKTADYEAIHIYVDTDTATSVEGLVFCTRDCTYDTTTHSITMTDDKKNPEEISQLVKNATDFEVDLSKLVSKNSVKFTIKFDYEGRKYTTSHTVLLRNKMIAKLDGNGNDYFKFTEEEKQGNEVLTVDVTPSDFYIWAGTTVPNPFTVTYKFANGSLGSGQTIWSLNPAVAGASINRLTGVITVGDSVTSNITVNATALSSINSAGDDTTKYKTGAATIHVKSIQNAVLGGFVADSSNPKLMHGTFTLTGTNLSATDLTDLLTKMHIDAGSVLRPSITAESVAVDGTLTYKVTVQRPVSYKGQTFPLTISCKTGTKTVTGSTSVAFTDDTDTINGVSIVAGGNTATGGGATMFTVDRGDSQNYELQASYVSGKTEIVGPEEWTLTSSDNRVTVTRTDDGYYLNYDVQDYNSTVNIDLESTYKDQDGTFIAGPSIQLRFPNVKLTMDASTISQQMYPITRGKTQKVSFKASGVKTYKLCVLDDGGDGLNTAISSGEMSASVTAKSTTTSPQTISFGLKDSRNKVMEGISCDIRFQPGAENTYILNGSKKVDTPVYIPYVTDISRFDSSKTTPGTNRSCSIYTADGEEIKYTNNLHKGNDNRMHQYWVKYKGETYFYDATSRQWRLDKTS